MSKKYLLAIILAVAILYSQNQYSLVALVNSADSTADFLYDANGNMISDGNFCYEYNDANQMQYVRDCVSQAINLEYVYDHSGRRLIEKHFDNGSLTKTVYTIGKHTETVVDAQGNQENTTYFRANNELIAKRNGDGTLNYYHQDHLGSTGVLTDDAGQVVESTKYYPYGGLRSGGTEGRYLYTGQEADQETGLYYYGARFYNPQLKRFVAADSILPDAYDPQQLSRYTYVRNNPVRYQDPTGNAATLVITISYGAIMGLIIGFAMVKGALTHPRVAYAPGPYDPVPVEKNRVSTNMRPLIHGGTAGLLSTGEVASTGGLTGAKKITAKGAGIGVKKKVHDSLDRHLFPELYDDVDNANDENINMCTEEPICEAPLPQIGPLFPWGEIEDEPKNEYDLFWLDEIEGK